MKLLATLICTFVFIATMGLSSPQAQRQADAIHHTIKHAARHNKERNALWTQRISQHIPAEEFEKAIELLGHIGTIIEGDLHE